MPESDKSLPENAKENLDRKLDHAIKETFPTSDPVSVTITKGGAIDYDEKGQPKAATEASATGGSQTTADAVLSQATEAVSSAASSASKLARDTFEQGRR